MDSVEQDIIDTFSKIQVLAPEITISIYQDQITTENYANLLAYHYMFYAQNRLGTLLEYFLAFSQTFLSGLGLENFKGGKDDLLSLINIIPGLGWNSEKARKISSLPLNTAMALTKTDYFNSVLGYVTGYVLNYDVSAKQSKKYKRLTKKTPEYAILAYLGTQALPFIKENGYAKRKLEHLYVTLSSVELRVMKIYIKEALKIGIPAVVSKIKMVPPPGINIIEYFLNSIYDYRYVNLINSERYRKNKVLGNISKYDDQFLLSMNQEPIFYRYRSDLLRELMTYRWSFNRNISCKPSAYPILTLGKGFKGLRCYRYEDVSVLWSPETVIKNRGFVIPDYKEGQIHKYLSNNDISSLIIFLKAHPERVEYQNILRTLETYQVAAHNEYLNKGRILVVCFDIEQNQINEDVKNYLAKTNKIDLNQYTIDYIGSNLMYINDTYSVIPFASFPDQISLEKLNSIPYQYDFIVYEHCPLGRDDVHISPLLDYSVLDTLRTKLRDTGKLILTSGRVNNVNRIKERFPIVKTYEVEGDYTFTIFSKI